MEDMLAKLIRRQKVTIPVMFVRNSLYLIGTQKHQIEVKGDNLMIKEGSSVKRLDKFIQTNHSGMEQVLYNEMQLTQATLEIVCTRIIKGMKLRCLQGQPGAAAKGGQAPNPRVNQSVYERAMQNKRSEQQLEAPEASRRGSRKANPLASSLNWQQYATLTLRADSAVNPVPAVSQSFDKLSSKARSNSPLHKRSAFGNKEDSTTTKAKLDTSPYVPYKPQPPRTTQKRQIDLAEGPSGSPSLAKRKQF